VPVVAEHLVELFLQCGIVSHEMTPFQFFFGQHFAIGTTDRNSPRNLSQSSQKVVKLTSIKPIVAVLPDSLE
jgi:hypothetical protein